jgi:hypothetical protein
MAHFYGMLAGVKYGNFFRRLGLWKIAPGALCSRFAYANACDSLDYYFRCCSS